MEMEYCILDGWQNRKNEKLTMLYKLYSTFMMRQILRFGVLGARKPRDQGGSFELALYQPDKVAQFSNLNRTKWPKFTY